MCLATLLKEQEEKNERERSAISLTKSYLYNREGNEEGSALIFPIPFKALFCPIGILLHPMREGSLAFSAQREF